LANQVIAVPAPSSPLVLNLLAAQSKAKQSKVKLLNSLLQSLFAYCHELGVNGMLCQKHV
jgi:hypothetical protein